MRKDGYRAITQVSRELKKLVKRNADVLVQLLQSGESSLGLPPGRTERREDSMLPQQSFASLQLSGVCGLTERSDEPEEVEVVEQQLTEHLDMEPQITLGVLCDQIVPLEDNPDEDQAVRDRLRSLVLGFMVGRAKRAIVERHADHAETVLVEGLLNVCTTLRRSPHICKLIQRLDF